MSASEPIQNQSSAPSIAAAKPLGHIHSVRGSQASFGLLNTKLSGQDDAGITVGNFVKVKTGKVLLVGVITDVSVQTSELIREQGYHGTAHVEIIGEITERARGQPQFRRGVTDYPTIGNSVAPLTSGELRIVFDSASAKSIRIGHAQQDSTIVACVDVDEMLNKHFAVLGTTGVGKSSGVALILQQVLQARPDLRILLLDVHNEYGRCFGERAQVVNLNNLRLPFWLFNFEEIVDVFFGGRPGLDEEIEILSEVIPVAKTNYTQYRSSAERLAIKKYDTKNIGFTVDTPVPYRLADLLMLIDERMGKLENRSSRMIYHKLKTRIETISIDPRYAFMFENANVGGDTMAEVISQLFRIPANGKPMTILQLAGFPAEVVDAVVSVICRMAFDFGVWSDGATPLLFVCEEAHRYAALDRTVGFGPTRRAISRMAKEGRKYGVYLGLVTQRPAELDPTVISQCSTLFAMRMSNDRDHAVLRSAIIDTAANLLSFVPSLGTREVLAFGVGVPLPIRLTFAELPQHLVPRREAFAEQSVPQTRAHDIDFVAAVVERWRGATLSQRAGAEDATARDPTPGVVGPDVAPLQPAAPPPSDSNRFSLLKKPLAGQSSPYAALRNPVPAQPDPLPQKEPAPR
jgi:hypothetical protein